ncbi:MAG: type II secretion system F family protein [Candidatus Omnitrophica bacterium]|nr:type II secretion system F family protein [Candidatus Omnitrophota bacterium]MCA9431246.1 type II secretion system F family protein [Candidatus Omnitrophota bacterium]MCA9437162.1 type II secretion system F family protein [Candidatus Omnitrophota bacterium]MCA9440349.1 type II secretion system F family protein [Candidatus Omnitrophota bacterium]MCB9768394.1 type II secretion system F family protein [Candidatus Omnitrophota bacterium]
MPSFEYSARDRSSGKTVQGIIEAVSQVEGLGILKDRGLLVTSINESRSRRKSTANKRKKKKRITIDDKVLFSRQMATMVNAGLPLIEGLSILGENIENGSFAAVINQIKSDVEGGDTLTDAMAKHPRVFDTLYVNLIRAGEAAGMLDQILLQLSTYLEKASSLQRKIKSAMIYPSVIVSVAVAVVTLLLIKVVPIFAEIFDSFDAELPAPTKLMIGASEFLQANFLYFLIGGVVGGFLFKQYIRTEQGRFQFDKALLKFPIIGELFQKVAIAKFTRTFSTLLRSGVNIIVSLEIVAKSSGNKVVEKAVFNVRDSIKEGESIATPLKEADVFPSMVVRMIDIGERTGALDEMLIKIADYYEEQVDIAVAGLTSLMEPLIICFLGVVVGGIVISMFLPMFQLGSIVGH